MAVSKDVLVNAEKERFLAPTAPPSRRDKKSERLAREIVRRIGEAGLIEGSSLPNEQEMLEAFGVGRPTLREALRLLESRGVLDIRAGRYGGPVVRKPNAADLGHTLTLMLHLEGATVADVLDARLAIEPLIIRDAAMNTEPDTLEELGATIDGIRMATSDESARIESIKFHLVAARLCSNPVLFLVQETLRSICDTAFQGVGYPEEPRERDAAEHEVIAQALRDGDPERAEQAARQHLETARSYWSVNHPRLFGRQVDWSA